MRNMKYTITAVLLVATVGLCIGIKIYTEPLEPVDNRFNTYDDLAPFQGYELLEISPNTVMQARLVYKMEEILNIFLDFWKKPAVLNETIHILLEPAHLPKVKAYLDSKNIAYKIINNHIGADVIMENAKHTDVLFNQYSGFDYSRYHNLYEIHQELKNLQSQYSKMATIFSLGQSYQRRQQLGIKITTPAPHDKDNRKLFFFNCGIHAREWVTPATCIYMIREMLTKYGKDRDVTQMIDKMDWYIVPVLNVDGYSYTWESSRNRMWRKTRQPNGRSSCVGTDPNRNFDIKWGGVGTSRNPCSDTYPGPRPWSEPCISNLRDFILKHTNDLAGYIDVHSYSQLWMTPWGYTSSNPPGYGELMRVSRIAVNALRQLYGTSYKYGSSSVIIYPTTGASEDWVYDKTWTSYAYGLELRDKGRHGFLLPSNQIIPTASETFAAFKAMALAMKI